MLKGYAPVARAAIELLEQRKLLTSVTGTTFYDIDGDDQLTSVDGRLSNVLAYLDLDANGQYATTEPSARSDANGNFSIDTTATGSKLLRVQFPGGYSAIASQLSRTVTIPTSGSVNAGTFGAYRLTTISGRVFDDANSNGVYDTGETGVYASLFLDSNNDGKLSSGEAFAAANQTTGLYTLYTKPGTHLLRALPNASTHVLTNPNDLNGRTITVTSLGGRTGVDFAARPVGAASGTVFNDTNANGVMDYGESGLARTIYADLNNNGVLDTGEPSTVSQSFGAFGLRLPVGAHTLRQVLPASWAQTLPSGNGAVAVNITQGVTLELGNVFGTRQQSTPVISGAVYADTNQNGVRDPAESGLHLGDTVYIDVNDNGALDSGEPSIVTQPTVYDSTFRFEVAPGTRRLRIIPASGMYVSQPLGDGSYQVTVDYNQTQFRYFGVATARASSVSGQVYRDTNMNGVRDTGEVGLADVTLWLDADNDRVVDTNEREATSLASGAFEFPSVVPGTYTLRMISNGALVTSPTGGDYPITVGANSVITGRDFGVALHGTISGSVYDDTDADGVRDTDELAFPAGHKLFLDADNDQVLDTNETTTTTDAKGNFYFYRILPGTYRVMQVLTGGYRQVTPTAAPVVNLDGNSVTGLVFGNTTKPLPPPPPPPTTTVTLEAENASFAGGTVKASNNAGFTGTGFADYAGQNSSATFNLTRTASGAATLTFRYANGSTANRPLQVLVNNVVVGTVACAPTGAWTTWKTVSLTNINLPAGAVAIKALASTSAGGANVDSLTVIPGGTVTPPPPPPPTTGSISGVLFMDANKNGIFDGSDYYLKDKLVFIDLDGDNAPDSNEKQLLSDANGKFTFSGLAAGTHKIRRVVPSGYKQTSPLLNVTLAAGQNVTGLKIITVVA